MSESESVDIPHTKGLGITELSDSDLSIHVQRKIPSLNSNIEIVTKLKKDTVMGVV